MSISSLPEELEELGLQARTAQPGSNVKIVFAESEITKPIGKEFQGRYCRLKIKSVAAEGWHSCCTVHGSWAY